MSTVFVFQNTSLVFLSEKLLKESSIDHTIIPTPKIDIVSCGISVKVGREYREEVQKILSDNNIEIAKIQDM